MIVHIIILKEMTNLWLTKLLISKFQAQLIYSNKDHMFIDGTFYSSPKCAYQILNVRIHDIKENNFYTVANAILCGNEMHNYIDVFICISMKLYIAIERIKEL
jgi:hypothetical protein